MTVGELIEILKNMPESMRVIVPRVDALEAETAELTQLEWGSQFFVLGLAFDAPEIEP